MLWLSEDRLSLFATRIGARVIAKTLRYWEIRQKYKNNATKITYEGMLCN